MTHNVKTYIMRRQFLDLCLRISYNHNMRQRKKISISLGDMQNWRRITRLLGYGDKSKYKLLRKLLCYAEQHPALFSSDSVL